MTASTVNNDFANYVAQKEQVSLVKQARTRVGISWLLHMFTIPPVVSLIYSVKTENYIPVLAATGAAIISAPIAFIDFGLTFFIAPPITSAVLIQSKAGSSRRKLGIFGPEQADSMMFGNMNNHPQIEVTLKKEVTE